ncbi:MAG: hypothetical protein GX033_01660 [Firmicutes bacterium]|nr:hypothetical protein [Bacillota bacterium]
MRSLVQEIAQRLGTQGTLTFLLRAQVGEFSVDNAYTLEEIERLVEEGQGDKCLLPTASALRGWPEIRLDLTTARRFLQGQRIKLAHVTQSGPVAVYQAEMFLGVGNIKQGILAPRKVLAKWEELSEL